jgi:hypothetical protein
MGWFGVMGDRACALDVHAVLAIGGVVLQVALPRKPVQPTVQYLAALRRPVCSTLTVWRLCVQGNCFGNNERMPASISQLKYNQFLSHCINLIELYIHQNLMETRGENIALQDKFYNPTNLTLHINIFVHTPNWPLFMLLPVLDKGHFPYSIPMTSNVISLLSFFFFTSGGASQGLPRGSGQHVRRICLARAAPSPWKTGVFV